MPLARKDRKSGGGSNIIMYSHVAKHEWRKRALGNKTTSCSEQEDSSRTKRGAKKEGREKKTVPSERHVCSGRTAQLRNQNGTAAQQRRALKLLPSYFRTQTRSTSTLPIPWNNCSRATGAKKKNGRAVKRRRRRRQRSQAGPGSVHPVLCLTLMGR
jgi:hypothetical protein